MPSSQLTNTGLAFTNSTTGTFSFDGESNFTLDKNLAVQGQFAATSLVVSESASIIAAAASGDVVGPNGATNNAIARFDQGTGKLIKNSNISITDESNITGIQSLALDGATVGTVTIETASSTTSHTLTLPGTQQSGYLQNNGNGILSWTSIAGSSSGPLNIQRFNTSGTYTPTVGTTKAIVYCQGAGGGGGGALSGVNNSVGSGGNAGCCTVGLFLIDNTKSGTVTIGLGGSGNIGAQGSNGGSSSFLFPDSGTPSGQISAQGGNGGNIKPLGTIDEYIVRPSTNVASGSISAVNEVMLGGWFHYGQNGGYGIMIAADVGIGGEGGQSFFGSAELGPVNNNVNSSSSGISPLQNTGSGGSGAIQTNNNGTSRAGGDGSNGCVLIIEY